MWRILQHDTPEDFVLATGETRTVREFVYHAFEEVGFELEFRGEGLEEKGIDKKTGKVLVDVNPRYFRPTEVDLLIGNPAKAKEKLGWEPKTKFADLVKIMARADLEKAKQGIFSDGAV